MDIKLYPYLVDRDDVISYKEAPYETFETCVMPGWLHIFKVMCNRINGILYKYGIPLTCFHFDQVKEKFGALRIYWHVEYPDDMPDPETDLPQTELCEAIDEAEETTSALCCNCGKKAVWMSRGWVLPYCHECATDRNKAANARHKTHYPLEKTFSRIQLS